MLPPTKKPQPNTDVSDCGGLVLTSKRIQRESRSKRIARVTERLGVQ